MNLAAIDFETANPDPTSACAVGLALVKDGRVSDRYSSLIRPMSPEFNPMFTRIHGITSEMVAAAPSFAGVWEELRARIGPRPMIAHNAPFDMRVLVACLGEIDEPLPESQFACTLQLAREYLPGLPNHRLGTLARVFGIRLRHHHAASDAIACAELAVRLANLGGPGTLERCLRPLSHFSYVQAESRGECLSSSGVSVSLSAAALKELGDLGEVDLVTPAAADGRFAGLRFVFTGDLAFLTRDQAKQIVESQGGIVTSAVSGSTQILVVGDDAWESHKAGGRTTGKLTRTLQLQEGGSGIRLVREDEFLVMVEAGGQGSRACAPAAGPLAGKTVVATGTLAHYTRSQIKQAIQAAGGRAASSVSRKTDYVLVGENPGSKADKARELGVTIITEDEFRAMSGQ